MLWLGATLIGLVLGFLAQVILRRPWWAVAAIWLVLVWLVFLGTALRRQGRDGLGIDLVDTVSPSRARSLETARLVRLAEAAPGPVYGLASWVGRRSLGGHGRQGSVGLTHLELVYGDPRHGPWVRVDTIWKRSDRPDVQPDRVRRRLTRNLWFGRVTPPGDLTPQELHRWMVAHRREIEQRPIPEWAPLRVPIDGADHLAGSLTAGDDWVALLELGVVLVGLRSRGVPAHRVALTRVRDLTPYVGGGGRSP